MAPPRRTRRPLSEYDLLNPPDHRQPATRPSMPQRHSVAPLSALPPGTRKVVTVATRRVALFNVEGRIFAIDNLCPHEGAPLSEGELDGTILVCPWHTAEFDLTCGKVLCPPAVEDVRSYPVFVQDGTIEIEL